MYDKINQLNTEIAELKSLLAQKEAELLEAKAELPLIEDMIEICESKGFTVKRQGTWLWKTGTDGRYDKDVTVNGLHLTDRNDETKELLKLGFQYSSGRAAFYWIENEDTRKLKSQRLTKDNQNEFSGTIHAVRCNCSELSQFEEGFLYDMAGKQYDKLTDKQKSCLMKILEKHDTQAATEIKKIWEA